MFYLVLSLLVWFVWLTPVPISHPQTLVPTKPWPGYTSPFVVLLPLAPEFHSGRSDNSLPCLRKDPWPPNLKNYSPPWPSNHRHTLEFSEPPTPILQFFICTSIC